MNKKLSVECLQREKTNGVVPFIFEAACDQQLKVINRFMDREVPGDDENAGHPLARCDARGGMIRHGLTVVCDGDAPVVCRPRQQLRVPRFTQTDLVSVDGIELREASPESSKNDLVEILIYEQTEHGISEGPQSIFCWRADQRERINSRSVLILA